MKKSSKILIVILAAVLLVGALALAVFASNTGDVKGKFVVAGAGYETWDEAVLAAENTYTIYLNEDWTVDKSLTISGETTKVKLNLNGKTVTAGSALAVAGQGVKDTDVRPIFKVTNGANFVLEGKGEFYLKSVVVEAIGASTVTVNADGASGGIVVNHATVNYAWHTAYTTFRIHDRAVLNVSGCITANAEDATRYVIDATRNSKAGTEGGAEVNISHAKIVAPAAVPVTSTHAQQVTHLIKIDENIKLTIADSELNAHLGEIIDAVSATYTDLDASKYKSGVTWLDGAASGVKFDELNVILTATDSKFISGGGGVSGSIMYVNTYMDAKFENCIFYGSHRAIISSGSTGAGTALNQHQLLFNDCHFFQAEDGTSFQRFFMYGVNYKIVGGSYSFAAEISQGAAAYLELTDAEGNPTGQWVGGYMDNTLLSRNFVIHSAPGDYNDFTHWPDSENSLRTSSVSVVIDGKSYTFNYGRFSDEAKYNALLFPETLPDGVIYMLDGNGITSNSPITEPFKGIYSPAAAAGTVSSVLDSKGNGYIKHYYENYTGGTVQSPIYPGFGSFVDTDFIVFEFDVSTDDGNFPHVWGQFQTREYKPLFDEQGNFLAEVGAYLNTPGFDILGNTISSPGTVEVSTEAGVWSRITFVFEMKRGEIEQIQVPAYYNDGTANVPKLDGNGDPVYITKNAFSILGSQVHFYVNGTYVSSVDFAKHQNGTYYGYEFNGKPGYIIEGYEASYKIGNDLRLYMNASDSEIASICYDNFYVAKYDLTADELGIYDENNELKSTITPNEYVLVMPDNNSASGVANVVMVDGEKYTDESEAFAAIKDGSTVTLLRDMKTPINVDEILANNELESISFEIIPGEYNFKGVISSTHKLVNYTGACGAYLVVPAEEGEIYGASYRDEEFDIDEVSGGRFAEGTLLPNGEELGYVGEKAIEGFFWSISGWEADYGSSVANGFYADANLSFVLIPAEYSKVPYYYEITAGGKSEYAKENVFGESLAAALQNEDVSIKLWSDVTLETSLTVAGTFDFDLNGNAVTVNAEESLNAFNLLPGTEVNIYSSREGARFDGNGNVTLLYSDYDRRRADTVTVNIGNGSLENLSINCAVLLNRADEYVVSGNAGSDDDFEYTKELILTVNGLNFSGNGVALDDGMITASAPISIYASNLAYNGTSELITALQNDRASLDASFVDSSFISADTLVRVPGETKRVSFENCFIDAELAQTGALVGETFVFSGESIILGEGCRLTFDGKLIQENGIKLKDGCVTSYADYENVRCYIDKPEKLALVSWIDVNGNVIGEANYNAPFGKLVELYGAEEVGVVVDSEWYNVEFEKWDIPEDLELSAGSYTIYPAWKAPKASVKCLKVDLVAYTYFKLNFYLPAELPDDIELYGIYKACDDGVDHTGESGYKLIDGEWYKLLDNGKAELGGKKYNSYTVFPGASDVSESEYKIVFAANGNVLVDTVDYGVPTYAEAVMNDIMKDGAVSGEEEVLASLVMNMVRYANESYKLANNITAADGYGAEKYEALLGAYASYLMDFSEIVFSEAEKNVNTSGLGEYMEGASFIFGAYQPRFVFKYRASALEYLVKPETSDGKIYTWPKGNRGVFTQIYHESYDGKESLRYIAPHVAYNNGEYVQPDIVEGTWGTMTEAYATTVDMSVRDATGVINLALYTPDGEVVTGSYSLAAYISYLDEASSATADAALRAKYEAFKSASMSLYAFSLVSQTYDYAVVNE